MMRASMALPMTVSEVDRLGQNGLKSGNSWSALRKI